MKIKDRRLNWAGSWAQVEYSDLSRMYTMRIYLCLVISQRKRMKQASNLACPWYQRFLSCVLLNAFNFGRLHIFGRCRERITIKTWTKAQGRKKFLAPTWQIQVVKLGYRKQQKNEETFMLKTTLSKIRVKVIFAVWSFWMQNSLLRAFR